VVKQLFRFAFDVRNGGGRPAIEAAFDRFRKSQLRFRELMVAMAVAQAER
jgi:hypothetical protein